MADNDISSNISDICDSILRVDRSDSRKRDLKLIIESVTKLNYLNPDDIPDIPLYMDQVTSFLDEQLVSYKRFDDDKILTKTMINNYAKNNLIPPPEKKKYSKNHMIMFIFIFYFKNFLSISDIRKIFGPLSEKFFDENSDLALDDIYRYIFNMEYDGMDHFLKDILNKFNSSKDTFPKTGNEQDDELLSTFSFICMLSFDVYVKKLIIEKLIDSKVSQTTKDRRE
ncbi:MAG: DUF1836 domain-containing protein [Lachnospiraceae bacterium]|nr:DUF1836 domain-containing protein [Lachnospiraceae bacterium]